MSSFGATYLQVNGPYAIVASQDAHTDLNPQNDRLNNGWFAGTVTAGAFVTSGSIAPGPATFSQVTITQGTITAQAAGLQQTVTWNNAAVVFTAQELDVTDTASNTSSLLANWTVGGLSRFSVTKVGTVTIGGSIVATNGNITLSGSGALVFASRSKITSSVDGNLSLTNNAGTGFTRLTLGLETNAFPSFRAVGSHFRVELADGSAYTDLSLGNLRIQNAVGAGAAGQIWLGDGTQTTVGAAGAASALPAQPTGYWIINVGGTPRVIPFYAQA